MARKRVNDRTALPGPGGIAYLTRRQIDVLKLKASGLTDKRTASRLGISVASVRARLAEMRERTGASTREELFAWAGAAGLAGPDSLPPGCFRDGIRDEERGRTAAQGNDIRTGYARPVSARPQDLPDEMDELTAADCREIIAETAGDCDGRPEVRRVLSMLHPGDTLMICKPDRVANSVNELIALLENELHAHGINLHVLPGSCAGLRQPDGATIVGKMLFLVAEMASDTGRSLNCEHLPDGSHAPQTRRQVGGRPRVATRGVLAIAHARRQQGESVTEIARELGIGRSTLYRGLQTMEEARAQHPPAVPRAAPHTSGRPDQLR